MTTELMYLVLVALLTGSLWIPVVIGYVRTRGPITPEAYRVAPGWFDGREAMAVWTDAADAPSYVVALDWRDGRVVAIRDFRYARYVMIDGRFEAEREHTA